MAAPPLMRSFSTRGEQNKKLQRPRPLKSSGSQSRLSADFSTLGGNFDDLMHLVETVYMNLYDKKYSELLTSSVSVMSSKLKQHGPQLESIYKDQLDRVFTVFRDACKDENLQWTTRLHLLELVELRANHWLDCDKSQIYYSAKMAASEIEPAATTPDVNTTTIPISTPSPPTPPVLAPGEILKTSGKFSKPTKIPGKNYCKDEVVIRNSDSGKEYMRPVILKSKVMSVAARYLYPPHFFRSGFSPVYMSPPRPPGYMVNPGAKERLVQITGPSEDKINHARQLMEDTIRRNASPIREGGEMERIGDSNSSLNSSASDESSRLTHQGSRRSLLHSFSTNDASIGEYKYTVSLGHDTVKITGTNHEAVRNARLVLEEYYNIWLQKNCMGDCYGLDEDVFLDPAAAACTPDVGLMHLAALDPVTGLDPALVCKPIYPGGPVPDRRSRKPSTPLSPPATEAAHTRIYPRELLVQLSKSQYSRATPPNWDIISEEFPAIVKKVYNPYYAYDHYYNPLPPFPPYTFSDGWTYVNPYVFPN